MQISKIAFAGGALCVAGAFSLTGIIFAPSLWVMFVIIGAIGCFAGGALYAIASSREAYVREWWNAVLSEDEDE